MQKLKLSTTTNLVFLFFIVLFELSVFASPNAITFQSKIIKPDGNPLEGSSVSFRLSLTDGVGTCVIYQEDFNNLNMFGSKGLINLSLGAGAKIFPVGPFTMVDVFNNYNNPVVNCQAGGTVTPGANDRRKLIVQFNDGNGWQTVPSMDINSNPFAIQAMSSQKLGDFPAVDYLRLATLPTCIGGEALHFNGTVFTCVAAGGGGGAGTVTQVTSANTDIGVATTTTTPVLTLNVGTGNNQIVKLNGSAQLPAVSGVNLTGLNASNLASGTVPIAQMPALTGDVTTLAGAVSTTIGANAVTSGKINDNEIMNADINSSAAIARTKLASGTNNHVVINDGSGVLSSEAQLAVSRGGTGLSSFTANALLVANGTGTAIINSTCSTGEILLWNGTSWACTDLGASAQGFWKNGGNTVTGTATLGTNSNHNLEIETNSATRVTVSNAGNVTIATPTSGSALTVNGNLRQSSGQVTSAPYDNGAAVAFDLNNGNAQYTSANCQAMTLTNMQDGGTYTIAVKGTTTGTCSFSHAGLNFWYSPAQGPTASGSQSTYTFLRMGNDVYVTWISLYQ